MSTSCRRSSMRKWRNCTLIALRAELLPRRAGVLDDSGVSHLMRAQLGFCMSGPLLRNKQITSVSRFVSLLRLCTTVIGIQGSAEGVIASSVFDAYLQYSDGENRSCRCGRTLRRSSSSAGRPPHESSIAKELFEIELDREELFAIDLDMDWRGPPGQRKSPKCQSPETRLEHVCQSARRDSRVSTNPGSRIGAERRARRIRLHNHAQEVSGTHR